MVEAVIGIVVLFILSGIITVFLGQFISTPQETIFQVALFISTILVIIFAIYSLIKEHGFKKIIRQIVDAIIFLIITALIALGIPMLIKFIFPFTSLGINALFSIVACIILFIIIPPSFWVKIGLRDVEEDISENLEYDYDWEDKYEEDEFIENDEDFIVTPKRREHLSQSVKDKVWNRDGGKCVECGSNEKLEFDHIIPHSKGGANTYRNIQLLCEPCNRSKSAKIG